MRSPATTTAPGRTGRPWLGLRTQPGRLALAVFRLPLPLYRARLGRLLGHTFLVLTHIGRRTGTPHATAAMVLRHDPVTHESVILLGVGSARRLGPQPSRPPRRPSCRSPGTATAPTNGSSPTPRRSR